MILSLRFKFDAAHRLMHHSGQCRNLHGHTWLVEVVIGGAINKKSGMVADFKDLKLRFMAVINKYDHTTILNKDDTILPPSYDLRRVYVDGEPTCENLSIKLFKELAQVLHTELGLESVRVWESKDASAIATEVMMTREERNE